MTMSYPLMKSLIKTLGLSGCLAFTAGCASSQPNTFTFTADLPPDFVYQAIAKYVPAKAKPAACRAGAIPLSATT